MKLVPPHLRKYVVAQDYSRYTSEDQAVWRFIMRQLKDFLSTHAHPCYVEGLSKTGIEVDRIPNIDDMNEKLQKFGWGAVPVSGFIPPAAFMEFQALGFLPIASDMRTIDHLLYTPAPDIVHEAAGHAPILVDPKFADYLSRYAQVASHAIVSEEDMKLYEAIRILSDVKENPESTPEQIADAEAKLAKISSSMTYVSEAGLLGRMNWWTAEYGLIGSVENPKIFGAGLLSSLGESRDCLKPHVRKIPLSLDCIDYSYDITEPQPQLFVTPHFERLSQVLEELSERMAFRQGGRAGLEKAQQARTVTTAQLNTGLQISGVLDDFWLDNSNPIEPITFLKFRGPSQLSVNRTQMPGHGKDFHAHGYSTPLGRLKNWEKGLWEMSEQDLLRKGIQEGAEVHWEYVSDIQLTGQIRKLTFHDDHLILVTLENCRVSRGEHVLFDPTWGTFDLAVGEKVVSVFGGPADRRAFGELDDFVAARVPSKKYTKQQLQVHDFYSAIRNLRENPPSATDRVQAHSQLLNRYRKEFSELWLAGVELLELAHWWSLDKSVISDIQQHLTSLAQRNKSVRTQIEDGVRLAPQAL